MGLMEIENKPEISDDDIDREFTIDLENCTDEDRLNWLTTFMNRTKSLAHTLNQTVEDSPEKKLALNRLKAFLTFAEFAIRK